LTLGLYLYLVADLAYGHLSLLDAYEAGDWPDGIYMAAFLLTALSAQYQVLQGRGTSRDAATDAHRPSLLPYAAVIVADTILVAAARDLNALVTAGLVYGVVVLTGLVLVRQIGVIRENGRLLVRFKTLAATDGLTGIANRRHFCELATERLARGGQIAVLVLDVDDFKDINDSLGHEAGDQALVAVGARLQACLGPDDLVARLGGDEFAILLSRREAARSAPHVAERIREALRAPLAPAGGEISVRASIGIANWSGEDAAELIRKADMAMYTAKRSGKGHHEVFEPAMDDTMMERLERGVGSGPVPTP
jgi:diguanylate cyclase (GGDEF)-like protein